MQKERKGDKFIKKPIYQGGVKAMRELIAKELKYPSEALSKGIKGSVMVRYEIDYTGKVVASKALTSLGYGCDEEACRVVTKLLFQVPKGPRKLKVKFYKTINIKFAPPVTKPVKTIKDTPSAPVQINYTVTTSKAKPSQKDAKPGTSYTYTIG